MEWRLKQDGMVVVSGTNANMLPQYLLQYVEEDPVIAEVYVDQKWIELATFASIKDTTGEE